MKRLMAKESSEPTTLEELYKDLKAEYSGKLFSDEFLKVQVDYIHQSQIIVSFNMQKP
jgi:hypothetical protein